MTELTTEVTEDTERFHRVALFAADGCHGIYPGRGGSAFSDFVLRDLGDLGGSNSRNPAMSLKERVE